MKSIRKNIIILATVLCVFSTGLVSNADQAEKGDFYRLFACQLDDPKLGRPNVPFYIDIFTNVAMDRPRPKSSARGIVLATFLDRFNQPKDRGLKLALNSKMSWVDEGIVTKFNVKTYDIKGILNIFGESEIDPETQDEIMFSDLSYDEDTFLFRCRITIGF